MATIDDRLTRVLDQIDKAKADVQRAKGMQANIIASLKKEFGVTTMEEAEALLVKLQKDQAAKEKELLAEIAKIERLVEKIA